MFKYSAGELYGIIEQNGYLTVFYYINCYDCNHRNALSIAGCLPGSWIQFLVYTLLLQLF